MTDISSKPTLLTKLLNETALLPKSKREQIMQADDQIERLLSQVWKNPYEVMLLNHLSTDDEVKQHYKIFMMTLHPDRCDHIKAKDAFNGKLKSGVTSVSNSVESRKTEDIPKNSKRSMG